MSNSNKKYQIATCVYCDSTATPTHLHGDDEPLCCSTCGAEWEYTMEEYSHEDVFGEEECDGCGEELSYCTCDDDSCPECYEALSHCFCNVEPVACPICNSKYQEPWHLDSIKEDGMCAHCLENKINEEQRNTDMGNCYKCGKEMNGLTISHQYDDLCNQCDDIMEGKRRTLDSFFEATATPEEKLLAQIETTYYATESVLEQIDAALDRGDKDEFMRLSALFKN